MRAHTAVDGLIDAAGHLSSTDLHTLIGRLQHLEASSYGVDDDLDVLEALANKNALA
jgi:hypothetical protein